MTQKIRNPETENPPNVPKMGSKLGASTDRNYSIENVCSQIQPSTKSERLQSVNTLLAPLCINNDLCCTVEKRIRRSIEWGLTKEKNALSSIKCFPTYVRALPTGEEECECLAIDLGGTNLRCIFVRLLPGAEPVLIERKSVVPKEIQLGSGENLFK